MTAPGMTNKTLLAVDFGQERLLTIAAACCRHCHTMSVSRSLSGLAEMSTTVNGHQFCRAEPNCPAAPAPFLQLYLWTAKDPPKTFCSQSQTAPLQQADKPLAGGRLAAAQAGLSLEGRTPAVVWTQLLGFRVLLGPVHPQSRIWTCKKQPDQG